MTRCLSLACTAVLIASCASGLNRIRDDIDDGDFQDAIAYAEEYLKEEGISDAEEAKKLLLKARFRQVVSENTASGYRDFLALYGQTEYGPPAQEGLARVILERQVRTVDTLDAYREFVTDHGKTQAGSEAKRRIAELEWREVDKAASADGYRAFLQLYGDQADLASGARSKLAALGWSDAERKQRSAAYLRVRRETPDGAVGAAAQAMADMLGYKEAIAAKRAAALLDFAEAFPHSERRPAAHDEVWPLVRRERGEDPVRDYRRFRQLFPRSAHVAEARAREIEVAWRRAEASEQADRYQSFAARYPRDARAPVAERRAADLRYWHSSREGELPRAVVKEIYDPDPGKIRLFVQVRDGSNNLMAGLAKEDFDVYENGRRAETLDFLGMESQRPVDVVMVIDTSGSMSNKINAVKQSAMRFAEILRFRQRDAAFGLVTYTDYVEDRFGRGRLTRDPKVFQQWVASIPEGKGGTENPVNALNAGLKYRFRKGAQRVFILLTDEEPNVPRDPKTKKTMEQMARKLLKKQVSLYMVAPQHADYARAREITRGQLLDMGYVAKHKHFGGVMFQLAELLSTQYTLWYASPKRVRSAAKRRLRVRVRQPKAWVRVGALPKGKVTRMVGIGGTPCGLAAFMEHGGVWVSKDCGTRWRELRDFNLGTRKVVDVVGVGQAKRWLVVRTSDGALWRWRWGAETLTRVGESLGTVSALAWASGKPGWVWALAGTTLHFSDNGGGTWRNLGALGGRVLSLAGDRMGACALLGDGRVMCYRKTAWRLAGRLALPSGGALPGGCRLMVAPWDRDVVFVTVPGVGLFRSLDGGGAWRVLSVPGGTGSFTSGFVGGSRGGWLCQQLGTELWCSKDAGAQWHRYARDLQVAVAPSIGVHARGGFFLAGGDAHGSVKRLFDVASREFVSGEVYFASGRATPKKRLLPFLKQLGQRLARSQETQVRIEGHTDSDGGDRFNQQLSERRAAKVAEIIAASGGRRSQLETVGYGESRPLFPNTTAPNKQRNRRVEILTIRAPQSPGL